MKSIIALSCLLVLSATASYAAAVGKNKAYDATYEMSGSAGSGTQRMASDGQGHQLMESNFGSAASTTIMDSNDKVMYMISGPAGHRTAMKLPLHQGQEPATTPEAMEKMKAKSLGSKVVAGHPSHGYRYDIPGGGTSESWIGDDINFLVASTTTQKTGGTTSMTLKSFSAKAPAASSFQLPAGIKVTDMSSFAKNMPGH